MMIFQLDKHLSGDEGSGRCDRRLRQKSDVSRRFIEGVGWRGLRVREMHGRAGYPPPRVGDKEILTGETGTAGGELQTREAVQTAGRGGTGRMQRGEETEETWTGTGGWNYSSVERMKTEAEKEISLLSGLREREEGGRGDGTAEKKR